VQRVSWEDAVGYLNRLTERENQTRGANEPLTRCYDEGKWTWERGCTGYRLPTEAEWEYAARARTETAYSFDGGAKEVCAYGNAADQAAKRRYSFLTVNEACDDGFADPAPVGSFKANAWGLYDMHGNVWEWVWDWYEAYPEQVKAVYAGPESGRGRVLRGGSFYDEPWMLRSSYRNASGPTSTRAYKGFRCARSAPPNHDP
jgi:formylglycine-generating enzyme required for sulfatase activity